MLWFLSQFSYIWASLTFEKTVMRNFLFYVFAALLCGLYSCSSDENQQESSNKDKELITAVQKARDYSKNLFAFQTLTRGGSLDASNSMNNDFFLQAENILTTHIEMVINNDIFYLLKKNGLNENLGFAILDYYEDMDFIDIAKKYKLSESEIQFLANTAECIDFIKEQDLASSVITRGKAGKTIMCTLAVVGSVGTTLSAGAIATPAGLAGWLFFKAVSLASIAGCAAS